MADGAREAKAALRLRMKAMRGGLTPDGLAEAGTAVARAVLGLPELARPAVVGCYLSVRRELPTDALVQALIAAGHTVGVPRVIDRAAGMELRRYVEPRSVDSAGLPTSDGPVIADADVVLCPGLAFDLAGGRLGYGAGYYDRWLADRPGAFTVGLAVDGAIVDEVPTGPDDRPMAALVTPSRVVRIGRGQPDKARVIGRVRAALAATLADLGRMTAMARDEATSAESRPENQYDTRALEASYLAAGQGERLEALRRLAGWADQLGDEPMDAVGLGALAGLDAPGRRRQWTLFAPRGGLTVRVDGEEIQLVSVSSPLGAALVGLEAGDSEEVDGPAGPTTWTVGAIG